MGRRSRLITLKFGYKKDRFITDNGYIMIKVDGKWVYEHRHLWEMVNGPIPKGAMLWFKDKDRGNTSLDNLELRKCIRGKKQLVDELEELKGKYEVLKRDYLELLDFTINQGDKTPS